MAQKDEMKMALSWLGPPSLLTLKDEQTKQSFQSSVMGTCVLTLKEE